MLFDKSGTGIDELKELTGFLYSYNNFENIRTDLELAQEDMAALIGDELMGVADEHYNSEDFGAEDFELLTELVKKIQLPVAYFAIYSFSQNADISHEDSGRKVKIDADREKMPWEWMLDKDEKAILKKAHKTTDRLISFLEKNISEEDLAAWAESDARAAIKGQFIDSAEVFNSIYPIDNSRRFFLVISPFIREAERKYIKPALTEDVFNELKVALAKVNMYGLVKHTTENDTDVKQKDTVTLKGNAGSVTVTGSGGLTEIITYDPDTSLAALAADFVSDNAADYLAEGIGITSLGDDIIFEAETAGTAFISPVVTSVAANADSDGLLPYIRTPLAYFAMSIAVDRLAVEVLPEGVFQNLISERLTQNAKVSAVPEVKREVSKLLFNQGQTELRILTEYLRKQAAGTDFVESDLTTGLDEDNLFARV